MSQLAPLFLLLWAQGSTPFSFTPCTWSFRPHPTDCGSYLVCDWGREVVQHCPTGLHWNPKFSVCDWQKSAKCGLGPDDNRQFDNSLDIFQGVDKDATCPSHFKPHASDCSKYYVCDHGEYKEFQCSSPLVWNPKVNSCDWKANVDCSGGSPSAVGPPGLGSGSTVGPSIGPPAPPPDETGGPPAPPPTPAPGIGTDATLVPIITGPSSSDNEAGFLEPTYKVVCYFTGWSWYRPGVGKFSPADVDPDLCTHFVYAFAVLNYNWEIKPADSWADLDNHFYTNMTALRAKGKKVTIALGGWNDSEGQKYSLLLRDPAKIQTLINSVVKLVKEYGFDGIDLDYEYPVCPHGECKPDFETDRDGFSVLVKGLRAALPKGSTISAAVSANKDIIDKAYDVRVLSETLDWIGVMDYDLHGPWDKKTGHIAPLYYIDGDDRPHLNVNYSIHHWLELGAAREKLVMGVPAYGQSFTLQDVRSKDLNAPISGPGNAGEYSRQGGILSYYEICSKKWSETVRDPEGRMGPYAIEGNQWVSYDDVEFIKVKMNYLKSLGLGGAMVWALDFDDFRNICGGGKYPLIKAIKDTLS